jgi:tRNA (guanine-N7-)-methyltransferase
VPSLRPVHLRSADPSAPNVAGVLVPTFGLEEPYDWSGEFARPGPLRLEIGPGKGLWLSAMAAADPAANWVGIEYKEVRARWIAEKAVRRGLTNVRVIWHEAREALDLLFTPSTVDTVYINFPDPWPKRRHRQRRMVEPVFCALLAKVLKPGGEAIVVTDVADYAREIVVHLERLPALQNTFGPGASASWIEGYLPTIHYTKFAAEGRQFHFIRFRRRLSDPGQDACPAADEGPALPAW